MMKSKCTRGQFSRMLVVNAPLEEYKRIARVNLCSEKGTKLRKIFIKFIKIIYQ